MRPAGQANERFPTKDSSVWLVHSFVQESTEVLLVLTPRHSCCHGLTMTVPKNVMLVKGWTTFQV